MKTKNDLTAPQPSPSEKPGGGCLKRLVLRLRLWREARIYNRAVALMFKHETYCELMHYQVPRAWLHHANKSREERDRLSRNRDTVARIERHMEAGITGMYD